MCFQWQHARGRRSEDAGQSIAGKQEIVVHPVGPQRHNGSGFRWHRLRAGEVSITSIINFVI